MSTSTNLSDYTRSTNESRLGRHASADAIDALEAALSAPGPGREGPWLDLVIAALETLIVALDRQSYRDLGEDSLLAEIQRNHPRLSDRIARLHDEHRDLRDSAKSLYTQIKPASADDGNSDIDVADVRDRLAAVAHRYRRHRAREADLVYEAINVDLGLGD